MILWWATFMNWNTASSTTKTCSIDAAAPCVPFCDSLPQEVPGVSATISSRRGMKGPGKRPGVGREFIRSLPHPATGTLETAVFEKNRNWCFDTCQKCIWYAGIFMSLPQRPHVSIFLVSAKETHEILVPIILEFGPTSVEISLLKKGEWIGGALHPKEHCHLRPVEEIKLGLPENSPLGSMILPTKHSKTLSFSFISRGFSNFSYISHDLPIDFPMQI